MAASRHPRPADTPLRNTLLATTAVHGVLPTRLKLFALLIALAIAGVCASFGSATTGEADRGDTHSSRGFGRHAPFVPLVEDAE